jgi:hypothetical protein
MDSDESPEPNDPPPSSLPSDLCYLKKERHAAYLECECGMGWIIHVELARKIRVADEVTAMAIARSLSLPTEHGDSVHWIYAAMEDGRMVAALVTSGYDAVRFAERTIQGDSVDEAICLLKAASVAKIAKVEWA